LNIEFALEAPNFSHADELRRKWWIPRPNSGFLWADILWFFVISAIDAHILPAITGGILPFSLMTPWLVVTFVVAPSHRSLVLLFFGGLFLETNSNAPRGLYLTTYWVIFSVLTLARKSLSWRHAVPWLVTFFFASFFVSNFESLVIFLRQDPTQLDFFHFAKQVVQVTLCVIVGMSFAQPWMARFKGDPTKT
jgi:hypothetical protein